jgi:hypothetical protein
MSGFTATLNQKTRPHQPGFFMRFFVPDWIVK